MIWLGSLIGGLAQAAGTLVGRVLVSLGIGYATYTGVDTSITWARDFTFQKLQGMPAVALQIASSLQVGSCVSILVSALAARMVVAGLTNGSITRMVTKG